MLTNLLGGIKATKCEIRNLFAAPEVWGQLSYFCLARRSRSSESRSRWLNRMSPVPMVMNAQGGRVHLAGGFPMQLLP